MLVQLSAYAPTIGAMGAIGGLLLVQLLVADVAGLKCGHTPGKLPDADHRSFLFRATRAHANTNESIAAFILIAIFAVASPLSPFWVNGLSWLYVTGRVAHMSFYYIGNRRLRSISFGISLISLFVMLFAGALTWIGQSLH